MKRSIIRITTAAAAVSAAAIFFPTTATAAPVSAGNCAKLSTATNPAGWGNTFEEEAGPAYTADKNLDEDGSLKFVTDSGTNRKAWYHSAGNASLADVATKPLKFSQSAGNANWQIRVTGANTVGAPASEKGFATFVWVGTDGSVDAQNSDQWWSTRALPGYARGATATLAELAAAATDETHTPLVTEYGVSSQPGAVGGTVYVDHISFNGCTTNFALNAPSSGNSGSLGNFGIANLISGRS